MTNRKTFFLTLLGSSLCLLQAAESSSSIVTTDHHSPHLARKIKDNRPDEPEYLRRRRHRRREQGQGQGQGQGHSEANATNATSTYYDNVFVLECTSTPIFLCNDDPVACEETIQEEQRLVVDAVKERIPGTTVLETVQKIINCIFIQLPTDYNNHSSNSTNHHIVPTNLGTIEGVKRITSHQMYTVDQSPGVIEPDDGPVLDDDVPAASYVGAQNAKDAYCATGKDVLIAVLDTGIDYTHHLFGGPGTKKAYRNAVEFKGPRDKRGRDFPTDVVSEGYDFVSNDDDPIDEINGHGSKVASNIRTVAPDAKLLAVRVCTTDKCPEVTIIKGIEYAVSEGADFINFSLGTNYDSTYNDLVSLALENAFSAGVLSIVAAGNNGNKPYTIATTAESPNALTVAATGYANNAYSQLGRVEYYSSRGPGANNAIKPDIAAPTAKLGAVSGSGTKDTRVLGTSFSTPIVTGTAALLKQRCPKCSPFAIKTILMNNALELEDPVTRVGSGEVRIDKAIEADFWAYCETEVQPSLSLGLVDVDLRVKSIRRTIMIHSLSDVDEILTLSSSLRDPDKSERTMRVFFDKSSVTLGACKDEVAVEVTFYIVGKNTPSNHMGYGGTAASASDGNLLDMNEIDGHILIQSDNTGKKISLPFHVLLRQAAKTSVVNTTTLPWVANETSSTTVELSNQGMGVAQIDAYSLIYLGADDKEPDRGDPPNEDIRSIGFRSREVDLPNCNSSLLEFSINTWERHDYLLPSNILINLDVDDTKPYDQYRIEFDWERNHVRIIEFETADITCVGFPPDDATNTANTIIRVCADDVGNPDVFNASFSVFRYPQEAPDPVVVHGIQTTFSAYNHDIGPFQTLTNFEILGTGASVGEQLDEPPLGLQLITNAYRSANNTGAATPETETLLLFVEGTESFEEKTLDIPDEFPYATKRDGPKCLWRENACENTPPPVILSTSTPTISPEPTISPTRSPITPQSPTCNNEDAVPRPMVPTTSPTGTCLQYGEQCDVNNDNCCVGYCKYYYGRSPTCAISKPGTKISRVYKNSLYKSLVSSTSQAWDDGGATFDVPSVRKRPSGIRGV